MSFIRTISLAILLGLLSFQAQSLRLQVNTNQPFVFIQVGHGTVSTNGMFGPPAGLVDEVSFPFPVGVRPGDGTAILGTPVIPIMVLGLSRKNRSNFTVTINSSLPLMNSTGDTIPFTEFSWTTQDGDIPAGTFSGGTQQTLMSFKGKGKGNNGKGKGNKGTQGTNAGVVDYLTFSYSNINLYPAGIYQGQVVYTITNL
jgi:hypothetical protein